MFKNIYGALIGWLAICNFRFKNNPVITPHLLPGSRWKRCMLVVFSANKTLSHIRVTLIRSLIISYLPRFTANKPKRQQTIKLEVEHPRQHDCFFPFMLMTKPEVSAVNSVNEVLQHADISSARRPWVMEEAEWVEVDVQQSYCLFRLHIW